MKKLTNRYSAAFASIAIVALIPVQLAPARTAPDAHAAATTDQVQGKEFNFKLSTKSIAKPGTVTFNFKNTGHVLHDFKINGKKTALISPGKSGKLVVAFKKKGTFSYLCTVPGHAAAGMKGVFTVR